MLSYRLGTVDDFHWEFKPVLSYSKPHTVLLTRTNVKPSTQSKSTVGQHHASHSAECFHVNKSNFRPTATTIRR